MIGALTLTQLRLLVGLHRSRSLTAAARDLHITQSAASHQLAEMERRLGVKLLDRRRNRLVFTDLGERALTSARLIVEETRDLEQAIELVRRAREGVVRISVRHYGCNAWLARFLSDRAEALPAVDVALVADTLRLPFESLASGDVDLAISPSPSREKRLISTALFSEPLLAVLPKSHALARLTRLEAKHFATETYASTSLAHEAGLEYERFMKPAGVLPQKFAIAATSETCIAYVGEGLGITCMPWSAVQLSRLPAAIVVRPLGPHPVDVTWYVSSRSGEPSASRAAAVSRILEGWARSRKSPKHLERSIASNGSSTRKRAKPV
jgi:LysR family transcriptional regulator for metE and metH